jgi:ribonuclease E
VAPAAEAVVAEATPIEAAANTETPPAKPRRGRRKKGEEAEVPAPVAAEEAPAPVAAEPAPPQPANDAEAAPEERPARRRSRAKAVVDAPEAPEAPVLERIEADAEVGAGDDASSSDGPPRRGWWQRTFGA